MRSLRLCLFLTYLSCSLNARSPRKNDSENKSSGLASVTLYSTENQIKSEARSQGTGHPAADAAVRGQSRENVASSGPAGGGVGGDGGGNTAAVLARRAQPRTPADELVARSARLRARAEATDVRQAAAARNENQNQNQNRTAAAAAAPVVDPTPLPPTARRRQNTQNPTVTATAAAAASAAPAPVAWRGQRGRRSPAPARGLPRRVPFADDDPRARLHADR